MPNGIIEDHLNLSMLEHQRRCTFHWIQTSYSSDLRLLADQFHLKPVGSLYRYVVLESAKPTLFPDSSISRVIHLFRLSSYDTSPLLTGIAASTSFLPSTNLLCPIKTPNVTTTTAIPPTMFRRLSSSLPKEFEYPADLEKLGSFSPPSKTYFKHLLTMYSDTTSTKMTRSAQSHAQIRNSTTSSRRMSISAMFNARQ